MASGSLLLACYHGDRCSVPGHSVGWIIIIIIILLLLFLTAIEFPLCGSSPYTSTDKTNNIHKRNNTKHSKYKYTYYQNNHT